MLALAGPVFSRSFIRALGHKQAQAQARLEHGEIFFFYYSFPWRGYGFKGPVMELLWKQLSQSIRLSVL
jgi:hypothetical protein